MTAPGLDTFIEEAHDLLSDIAQKLLQMESDPDDEDLINDIFRTAHTLKGNAGIFELTGVQTLTHTLESLLDALRHNEIEFEPPMVDALLDGFDRVKEMIEVIEDGGDHKEVDATAEIAAVKAMLPDNGDADVVEDVVIEERDADTWLAGGDAAARKKAMDAGAGGTLYGFVMNLDDSIYNFGIDPLRLFDEALALGNALYVEVDASDVPPLDTLDPYSYNLKLAAVMTMDPAQHDAFIEVFDIVAELGEVFFFRSGAVAAAPSAAVAAEAVSGIEIPLSPVHEDLFEEMEALLKHASGLDAERWQAMEEELREALDSLISLTNPEARMVSHAQMMTAWLDTLSAPPDDAITGVLTAFVKAMREQSEQSVPLPSAAGEAPAQIVEAAPQASTSSAAIVSDVQKPLLEAVTEAVKRQQVHLLHLPVLMGKGEIDDVGLVVRCRRILANLQAAADTVGVALNGMDQLADKAGKATTKTFAPLAEGIKAAIQQIETGVQEGETQIAPAPPVTGENRGGDRRTGGGGDRRAGDRRAGGARPARKEKVFGQSIKIDQVHLDQLMELVGEMAVAKNAIPFFVRELATRYGVPDAAAALRERGDVIARITDDLQDLAMRMRMLPVSNVFQKFPRLVRDTARKLNKKIELKMSGEEVLLDKTLIEAMSDPLVHMVRNSLDHGIEMPELRKDAGKPEAGCISLDAWQEGNTVCIRVRDNGKGIDPDAMRINGVEKGMVSSEEAAKMNDKEAQMLIFKPGFSAAAEISDLSGRGVGMDVVATAIASVKGVVDMNSEPGKGTDMILRLPLSLAITKVLIVHEGGQIYGLPAQDVVETLSLSKDGLSFSGGRPVTSLRGDVLPLIHLEDAFAGREPHLEDVRDDMRIVVAQVGGARIGVIVDRIERDMDIMIKPLPGVLQGLVHLSGGAILGDGRLLFVVDTQRVITGDV